MNPSLKPGNILVEPDFLDTLRFIITSSKVRNIKYYSYAYSRNGLNSRGGIADAKHHEFEIDRLYTDIFQEAK